MATKSKKSTAKKDPATIPEATVTKITAKDSKPVKKSPKKTIESEPKVTDGKTTVNALGVLKSIGGYFKGAWTELRQVRWPNRKATWGLTAAVLIFTAFFVVLIVLLDILFKYLFELILG